MARLTIAEYDRLRREIFTQIKRTGFVPPVRELAAQFDCSPVTAWRIVRSQGWRAKGHRWVEPEKKDRK